MIDRELKVAVECAGVRVLIESLHDVGSVDHIDVTSEFASGHEPEGDIVDCAEEAIAADGQAKEVGVTFSRAFERFTTGIEKGEGLDVGDKRGHAQTAPVDIGRDCSTQRQIGRAGLFLADAPAIGARSVKGSDRVDERWPLDPGLGPHEAALRVELQQSIQASGINAGSVARELLAAHGVSGSCQRELARAQDGLSQPFARGGGDNALDSCWVETAVCIVEDWHGY